MDTEELKLRAQLAAKKSKVREQVKGIIKTGNNTAQHYKYAEEIEVLVAVRKAMIEIGIDFSMEATSAEVTHTIPTKSGQMAHFVVHLACTLTDTETGYSEKSPWLGSAADSGDKAVCKAYTSGLKYFLMKTFLLPTGDDLEAFGGVDEPATGKQQAAPRGQQQNKGQAGQGKPQTVTEKAWDQYRATFQGDLPSGCIWDFNRFVAAVKAKFAGKLPTNEASIAKILAANIPHVECWRASDGKAAA